MAVRGRGSLKFLQDTATLSKEELSKMEKDAERRTADRKKLKESGKKAPSGTRRAQVQARRAAQRNIPKAVRDLMISEKQDKQNKGDSKLRSQNRGKVSKSGVEQSIKSATDKAKSTVKSAASRVGPLSKALTGLGALLYSSPIDEGGDVVPKKQTERGKKQIPAGKLSTPEPAKAKTRGRGDGASEVKQRRADAAKSTPKAKAPASGGGGGSHTVKSGDTMSAIAQRAGVTLKELKAANPQIKDINKIRPGQNIKLPKASIKGTGKSIYAAKGGMIKANCGASMKPTQKSSQGNK